MGYFTAQLIHAAATPADQRLENAIAASQGRVPQILAQRKDMLTSALLPTVPPSAPAAVVTLPGGPLHTYEELHPTSITPSEAGQAGAGLRFAAWATSPAGVITLGLAGIAVGIGGVWLWKRYRR